MNANDEIREHRTIILRCRAAYVAITVCALVITALGLNTPTYVALNIGIGAFCVAVMLGIIVRGVERQHLERSAMLSRYCR